MTSGQHHVVFGAGQVGRTLAARLASDGQSVRVVSLHQPSSLPTWVEWRAADVTDPDAATQAALDGAVLYQCLNAPYDKWPELFPPLQRGVLAAAERTGALLVTLENLYGYGPTGGAPITEDLPLAADTVKGRTRAAMTRELLAAADAGRVRIAIGRASDFFGPGVTASALGARFFARAVSGKKADFLGNPNLRHTYSYVPDIAHGLATLGTDERAAGQVWHLPGPATVTTREIAAIVSDELERSVDLRIMPRPLLSMLAVVSPLLRALKEMAYEFEEPFVLDTTKYESTFGSAGTPLHTAVADTISWYRSRTS